MNKFLEKEYALRISDFDKYNRIKPSAILELFQDAAGHHADEIGVGYDSMIKKSYFWVLVRVKFKIISYPTISQVVVVKTWPLQPNRLSYRREFCIKNKNGEDLIIGSSEWVIMHTEKRRLVADSNLYDFVDGFHTEMMFEGKILKVTDFDSVDEARIINPAFTDIDTNNHVNNTKYANYVIDTVSPGCDDVLETFQIDYRKEVFEGTQLSVHQTRNGNEILAKGVNDNGETMFACKLDYK